MSEVDIINDAKIIEKQSEGEIYNNDKDNNFNEKLDNKYKLNISEDKDINSKTVFTETSIKNNSKNDEKYENNLNSYAVTTSKKNNGNSNKNTVLQEKLKKIFMVREKGKYEYNKQDIPENLKYHSDSDSSEISELRNSKKLKLPNNNGNPPTYNQITPKISVKRQNSGCTRKEASLKTKNIKKEKNNEKNSEEENNSPNLPKNANTTIKNEITPIIIEKNNQAEEKKFNNFNKKIIDNYINEMNKNENSEISEKNKGKSTAIKDIIEKLKAKKIEKEELGKKEKEAEEQ